MLALTIHVTVAADTLGLTMSPPRLRPALRERLSMNRIWFRIGSQALYGDDVIAQLVPQSQQIAKQLDNASEIPCEVVAYHLVPGAQKIVGAHMPEVSPPIAAGSPRSEIHPLGIGDREDPVRLVYDGAPGPEVVLRIADIGDRSRLVAKRDRPGGAGRAATE